MPEFSIAFAEFGQITVVFVPVFVKATGFLQNFIVQWLLEVFEMFR